MANDYYSESGYPSTGAQGSSASMRSELALVSDGFDKLPALTGNGSKVVRINSGGTAQEAVAASTLIAETIVAASGKTTPVDADTLPMIDSEASSVLKELTFANLWAWIVSKVHAATSKATPVDADELLLSDSAASFVGKKLTWANLKTTLGSTFAAIAGSVSQAFSAATIELGHASDTTLSRVSAGVIAVEGVNIATASTACMLTGNQSIAGIKTFSDTTDASSSTVGGTVVSGGLAVAKAIIAGTYVEAPRFRSSSGTTSALSNTFTTLFTATAGMYLISMRLTDSGTLYVAEGIAMFDTLAGTMLQTANGASAALQVSGMDVQGKQVSGGTTNINWVFFKIL